MPVVYRHTQDHTTVLLWAITESEEQLNSLVNAQDRASAGRFRSSLRRIEHLAWRAALRQIVGDAEVCYNDTGAPYIAGASCCDIGDSEKQEVFISAAHARGMAAVIVSNGPCAIDTESVTRNLERTSARFISPAERVLSASGDPEFPVMIWCAKEALYKFSGRRELDFLTDLEITAADPAAGEMTGRIAETRGVRLNVLMNVLRFEEYVAVYIKG